MGDTHPRAMEGSWGSGNDVSWPVECLLNGMNPSDHMMFGNGGSHGQVISSPFRHRFQPQPQQPMHISTGGLPLSSSINVSIPSHAMVEESGQDEEMNNGASVITGDGPGQDRHVPQNHPLGSNDVLEDTDDGSEDDEEEEEVDEGMIMHRRNVQLSHPHTLDENSMVPCQHQVPVRDNLSGLMPMAVTENHCHPKLPPSVILRNGVGVNVNEHSIPQQHSHQQQQHPHSMMPVPVFPQIDDFGQAQGESQLNQQGQGHNDPNIGYSVYGKMYFEGRIVLHLKQGNYPDPSGSSICMNGSNGMNFNSCGDSEVQKGQHFQGCAACRLRSPLTPENHRRPQRDSHRHTIRGVLFTFEDCTIVELYPDQLPPAVLNGNCNGLKPNEDANKMSIPNGHAMPMSSYLTPSMLQQHEAGNPKQRSMQHMEIEPISMPNVNNVPPPTHAHQEHLAKPQQNQNQEHTSWWDEFDSDADGETELREAESTEEESNQGSGCGVSVLPSCMDGNGNKLGDVGSSSGGNNGSLAHVHLPTGQAGHLLHESTGDDGGGDDQDQCQASDEEGVGGCSQYVKYKCNICSDEFGSRNQLDSHICLTHSLNQSQPQHETNAGIPQPQPGGMELDLSSSSNSSEGGGGNSNNTSFDRTNTPDAQDQAVTTPTMTELDDRNDGGGSGDEQDDDDDCQSGLNIALSGEDSYSPPASKQEQESDKAEARKPNGLKHACPACAKSFQAKKTLKAHLKECCGHQRAKCKKCSIEYADERELRAHNCPFLYLQSPIEATRKRRLKPGRSKPERKPTAKKRKLTNKVYIDGGKSSKICGGSEQSDENCGVAKIRGNKMIKKAKARTKKMSLIESRRYNEESRESSSPEIENEDSNSNGSSLNHFVDRNRSGGGDDSDSNDNIDRDGSSSQDDEYEGQDGDGFQLELNSLPKNHKLSSSLSQNRKTAKTKRKSKGNAKATATVKFVGVNARGDKCEKLKRARRTDKSSQCDKCGKRFARKDKLMRHMYVHSEEKMFACHICEKRFSRRDKLSDHLKSHGSDEVHHCPMCKKEFLRPDILKQHVKLHGMGNKHQCPDCLRFVTGRDRLEKHMARHEEARALGQTLLCPLCTKYFIQRQSLKAHIKKFHPHSNLMEHNIPAIAIASSPQSANAALRPAALEEAEAQAHDSSSMSAAVTTNAPTREASRQEIFPCRQCPRQFRKRLTLKKHQRRHLQDQHLKSTQDGRGSESQILEDQPCRSETPATASSGSPLSHCSILLSIASQMQCSMVSSSPRSMSPVISGAMDSTPSPAHAVLPTPHPPTPPLTTHMNSMPHVHGHALAHANQPLGHLSTLTSVASAAPPAHIPLSSQSAASQQGNIVGMSAPGALHSHLGHAHHSGNSNAQSLQHSSATCSHSHAGMQTNLSHHMPMSPLPLQHMNVGMTPPFSYYSYQSYQ